MFPDKMFPDKMFRFHKLCYFHWLSALPPVYDFFIHFWSFRVLLSMASVEERRVRSTMHLTTPELLVHPRDHDAEYLLTCPSVP
jgi:hypothetical protein